ncbi:MAG: beta-galactosidase, partial [Actinomycetota bacterium]|nr:beta-galactosidase [Actinomycetota bacterium]
QIRTVDAANGVLEVRNEHAFVDLSWLQPSWIVEVDGVEIAAGELEPLDTAPGAASVVTIPLPVLELAAGERAHLTISFRTRADLAWAPAGHEIAWEQFEIAAEPGVSRAPGPTAATPLAITSLQPAVMLWRAPIDNETFGPGHAGRWEQLGLRDGSAQFDASTEIRRDGDGLTLTHTVSVPDALDDIPRVGARLRIGPGVHAVEWLGAGPHECYSDRRASARVGRWITLVDEWPVPYVHPQASGNRIDVRWLRFLDAAGEPLLTIDELDNLQVTVARVTDEELDAVAHLEELDVRDECYVWIDVGQRGVGSGACGPDTASAHRIGPGTYHWSYRLG